VSGNDLRISNPGGTSIYESLTIKKNESNQPNAEIVNQQLGVDNNVTNKSNTGKVPSSEIKFQEPKVNSLPLIDENTQRPLLFQVDSQGNYLKDAEDNFLLSETGGKPIYVQVDEKNQPVLDKDNKYIIVEPESTSQIEKKSTENNIQEKNNEDQSIMPLTDMETGNVLLFKVDKNGQPLVDKKGDYLLDPDKGQPVFVKVDKNGNALRDKEGNFVIVSQNGDVIRDVPQSFKRLAVGLTGKKLTQVAINKTSSFLIKGVSVGIPFTKASVGFGVKHAVIKAVSKEVQGIKAAKTGSTTIVNALNTTSKTATEGAIKTLTESGRLGKGVETLGIKEVTKVTGGRIKALSQGIEGMKVMSAEIAEGGIKAVGAVGKKTVIGATEKALKKGVEEGIETGIKKVIVRSGEEIAEKVTTKGVQKALSLTAEKAAVEATTKISARFGSKLAGVAPVIGVAAGSAIAVWDAKDALKKTRDKNVSLASKSLAWTTVGLDVVSTVAEFSGKGKPVGWAAMGLSIGTSTLSDYLR